MELYAALVGTLAVSLTFVGFKLWLDRVHPAKKPDPTGKELLERLEAHERAVTKQIEALAGRIGFKERPRLRE